MLTDALRTLHRLSPRRTVPQQVVDTTITAQKQYAETVGWWAQVQKFPAILITSASNAFGSAVWSLTIPLAAISVLHASALTVAVLGATYVSAAFAAAIPAGIATDVVSSAAVVRISMALRAVAGLLAAAVICDPRIGLFVTFGLMACAGALSALFDVAILSSMRDLRSGQRNVYASVQGVASVAGVLASVTAGFLLQGLGPPAALIAGAGVFAVGVIPRAGAAAVTRRSGTPTRYARSLRDGIHYLSRDRTLQSVLATTTAANFANGIGAAVFVVFLYREVALQASAIGLVQAAGSLAFVGAALVPFLKDFKPRPILAASQGLTGLALLLVPLFSWPGNAVSLLCASRFAIAVAAPVYNVEQFALRSVLVPEPLVGCVNGLLRVVGWSTRPAGALVGGLLAERFSARTALLVAAVIATAAPSLLWSRSWNATPGALSGALRPDA